MAFWLDSHIQHPTSTTGKAKEEKKGGKDSKACALISTSANVKVMILMSREQFLQMQQALLSHIPDIKGSVTEEKNRQHMAKRSSPPE